MPTIPVPKTLYPIWHPTRIEDLEPCLPLIQEGFLLDAPSRKRLLKFWRHLVSARACISVTVEDRGRSRGSRQVGFGLSVFVTESVTQRLREGRAPYPVLWLPKEWEEGKGPVLEGQAVARANREGRLDLLILHYGWDQRRYGPQEQPAIIQQLPESFIETHRGYRFRELWQEVYGEDQRDMVLNSGHSLFRAFPARAGERRPFLLHSSPKVMRHGTFLASLFVREASLPRFGLKPPEQELVQQALHGLTEGDAAKALGISPNTIKKRWQSIYQKVDGQDPGILAPQGRNTPETLKLRRRFLLDYLRLHPEELRPY